MSKRSIESVGGGGGGGMTEQEKKARRTPSTFTVHVGGEAFRTSRQTLKDGSPYFAAFFESNFSDGELAEEDNEMYLDRDPVPFVVLLSYWRNGTFICPASPPELLAKVLVEAEYFLLDTLLTSVKRRCIRNLYSTKGYDESLRSGDDAADERVDQAADERFPNVLSLIESPFFPQMYHGPVHYARIISTEPMPEGTYAIASEMGMDVEYPCISWITYERVCDKVVMREPLIATPDKQTRHPTHSSFETVLSPWTLLELSSMMKCEPRWFEKSEYYETDRGCSGCPILMPYSVFIHTHGDDYYPLATTWVLRTRSALMPVTDQNMGKFIVADGAGEETRLNATHFQVVTDLLTNEVKKTIFVVADAGYLMNVEEISNFQYFCRAL